MTPKDALIDFKKMWVWLCAFPEYNREYYIKKIIKGDVLWINHCPLCNKTKARDCNGCEILWGSNSGTLCTDPRAPIHKWNSTATHDFHNRSFYASQVAVLAIRYARNRFGQVGGGVTLEAINPHILQIID